MVNDGYASALDRTHYWTLGYCTPAKPWNPVASHRQDEYRIRGIAELVARHPAFGAAGHAFAQTADAPYRRATRLI